MVYQHSNMMFDRFQVQSRTSYGQSVLFLKLKIIMHQLIMLNGAIWPLQLVISSPVIHALGDLSRAPTGIQTLVPRLRGRWFTNWAIPPQSVFLKCCWSSQYKHCVCFNMVLNFCITNAKYSHKTTTEYKDFYKMSTPYLLPNITIVSSFNLSHIRNILYF